MQLTPFDFYRGHLIPNMMPYNGTNPRSILIMDKLKLRHATEVIDLFTQAGILVIALPPYSPDLNPIEETFSYIRSYLKTHQILLDSLPNPLNMITSAFISITDQHCQAWISHAGYSHKLITNYDLCNYDQRVDLPLLGSDTGCELQG